MRVLGTASHRDEILTRVAEAHNILQKLHVHSRIDASSWHRQGGFHLKLEA